jgi:hypothetical protein
MDSLSCCTLSNQVLATNRLAYTLLPWLASQVSFLSELMVDKCPLFCQRNFRFSEPVIEDAKRKAFELETLDIDTTEDGAKKYAKVESFMSAYSNLPVSGMSASELRPHLTNLFPPYEVVATK